MSIKIENKYEETKARLREKILENNIDVRNGNFIPYIRDMGASCFFCKKRIKGQILVLIEDNFYSPIDIECFHKAKTNFYINGIAYSVN